MTKLHCVCMWRVPNLEAVIARGFSVFLLSRHGTTGRRYCETLRLLSRCVVSRVEYVNRFFRDSLSRPFVRSLSHVILARDKAYFIQSSIAHGSQASLCECSCVHLVKRDDIQEREEIVRMDAAQVQALLQQQARFLQQTAEQHTNAHTHRPRTLWPRWCALRELMSERRRNPVLK